jgi:CRISPR/Cas system Type II protein with McrA/HNH and RuvC-like nuclease domain
MHTCKACSLMLPTDHFRVHKRGYRIGKCKGCEREYQRAFYAKGGETTRARKRVHMAKIRKEQPERIRSYQRETYASNREAICAQRREHHRTRIFWTRALHLRGITAIDLARLWKSQRGLCALTGRKLDRTAQLDHKLPLARGGTDDLANLQWTTAEANRAKRDLTDVEFHALCVDAVRWIGQRIDAVALVNTAQPAIKPVAELEAA